MAGIGFRIRKLLRSDDVYDRLGGVAASVFLSSGPWLFTILSIACISWLSFNSLDPKSRHLFRIVVNYNYAASLILFGAIEMVTTRYLADAIYLRQEKVVPTLFAHLAATVILGGSVISLPLYWLSGALDWRETLLAGMLFSSLLLIWCCMIFLSACKDYIGITTCFALGMVISVLASLSFGHQFRDGILGPLAGYTVGQVFIACSLSYLILLEFGTNTLSPRDYFPHCSRNSILIFVGWAYASAIWIDKMIFWFSPQTGEVVVPFFYKSSAYDAGTALAYLTVVPSMAYFMVQMETKFYMAYRQYFSLIDNRANLQMIEKGREQLVHVIRRNVGGLLLLQGAITIPLVLYAPQVIHALQIPVLYATVFRYALIASFLHIMMLLVNILILYFDLPRIVALNYAVFLILNGSLSYLTARLEYQYHCLGYALAAFIGLLISVVKLNLVIHKLHFFVFMKQPLAKPSRMPLGLETVSLAS